MKCTFLTAVLFVASAVSAVSSAGSGPVFTITQCAFDERNLVVRVSWLADSAVIKDEIFGGLSVTLSPGEAFAPLSSFRCSSLSGDTTIAVPDAIFDTLYSIGLWTKRQDTWIAPDSSATRIIRVASSFKQPVSFFSSAGDTVKALVGRLLLWKGPDYPAGILPNTDTVASLIVPDSMINGFISLGRGVRFLHPGLTPAFFIALKFDGVEAGPYLKNIRCYRDSSGVLLLQPGAVTDTVVKRVYFMTSDLTCPFFLLADTVAPLVRVLSDTSTCIDTVQLTDSLSIADNCPVLSWKFYCAPGTQSCAAPVSSGFTQGKSGRIYCSIPASGAQAAGIRAFLIVSDGVFIDTIDLSRRSVRLHSDAMTTPANAIVPISSSADPFTPGLQSCLQALFEGAGNTYDPSKFRVYRWQPQASNSQSWVEYASARDADFQFRPGNLFWLITDKSMVIDIGRCKTTSLKSTYALPLSPHNWTDIAVPFGFNLSLSEVIEASGASAEDIIIYRWLPDSANRTYQAHLVYGSAGMAGNHPEDTLFSGIGNGYTVFNPFDTAFTLRLPPRPVAIAAHRPPSANPAKLNKSRYAGIIYGKSADHSATVTKRKAVTGYCVKVSAYQDDAEIGAVYCGMSDCRGDTTLYPSAPSFSQTNIRIRHPSNGTHGGIMLYPSKNGGVQLFPVEVFNGSVKSFSARISASPLAGGAAVEVRVLQKCTDGYKRITEGGEVDAAAGKHAELVVAAGTKASLDAFLAGTFTAPDAAPYEISYAFKNNSFMVSFAHVAPGDRCRTAVYNARGQRIIEAQAVQTASGKGCVRLIAPKLPSGVYVLKSSIVSGNHVTSEAHRIALP